MNPTRRVPQLEENLARKLGAGAALEKLVGPPALAIYSRAVCGAVAPRPGRPAGRTYHVARVAPTAAPV